MRKEDFALQSGALRPLEIVVCRRVYRCSQVFPVEKHVGDDAREKKSLRRIDVEEEEKKT